jgi:hypothetical protein
VFPISKRNGDSFAETAPESRKQYQPPGLRKLTPEQAKLLLIGHASMGNEGAKELLLRARCFD